MENTAGNARRCHPDHQNSSCFHPGNLSKVFSMNASNILQRIQVKGRSRKPGQPVTATAKATRMNKKVIGLITKTTVVYYLPGQTGRSTVWVNGKQNSGLVNFVPESRLPFEQISSIHRKPIAKGG